MHQWIGTDRRHDPDRVIAVLNDMDADIIGLQEAVLQREQSGGVCVSSLASATHMEVISAPTFNKGNGQFGNVLLTRRKVCHINRLDLSVGSREPRGALDVTVDCNGLPIKVMVTHLGLRWFERKHQVKKLLESVEDCPGQLVVVMGDFNMWFPVGRFLKKLASRFSRSPALRTYPSWLPLFPLDRIWVSPKDALRSVHVHKNATSIVASDHLPIEAAIEWPRN